MRITQNQNKSIAAVIGKKNENVGVFAISIFLFLPKSAFENVWNTNNEVCSPNFRENVISNLCKYF